MLPLALVLFIALPGSKPPEPPPEGVHLVLTQPDYPFPLPELLVIDIESPRELPFNFRSSADEISTRPLPGGTPVTTDGLAALNVSGSGQFSPNQFYELQMKLADRAVTIVDLRLEPHAFINNMAVSWGPINKLPDVRPETLERQYLDAALAGHNVTITSFAFEGYSRPADWEAIKLPVAVRKVRTEPELVAPAYWDYERFSTADFSPPPVAVVDRFVDFIRDRDPNRWLHLHCDSGLGRTTLFLTMIDMMANSGRLPAPALIERQHRLGGSNLADTRDPNRQIAAAKRARLAFLEDFYRYCRFTAPHFFMSWETWA
ncbi:MAG: hypothetical protein WA771_13075, partial [Chthoniobacterales bacterium]